MGTFPSKSKPPQSQSSSPPAQRGEKTFSLTLKSQGSNNRKLAALELKNKSVTSMTALVSPSSQEITLGIGDHTYAVTSTTETYTGVNSQQIRALLADYFARQTILPPGEVQVFYNDNGSEVEVCHLVTDDRKNTSVVNHKRGVEFLWRKPYETQAQISSLNFARQICQHSSDFTQQAVSEVIGVGRKSRDITKPLLYVMQPSVVVGFDIVQDEVITPIDCDSYTDNDFLFYGLQHLISKKSDAFEENTFFYDKQGRPLAKFSKPWCSDKKKLRCLPDEGYVLLATGTTAMILGAPMGVLSLLAFLGFVAIGPAFPLVGFVSIGLVGLGVFALIGGAAYRYSCTRFFEQAKRSHRVTDFEPQPPAPPLAPAFSMSSSGWG